eukprot:Transcript_18299.p3 GENE.Transcript_18299~~Transcript_18299.p3  ORF type:complete len:407 (-),score=166.98 Transcript_18299:127-1251(-)
MMMLVASVGWSALRQPPRSALRPPPRRAAHGLMTAAGRKRVVFLGTPECAARSLELLIAAAADGRGDFELAAVVSQPPARTGRKMRLTNSPVHVTAEEAGLPVLTPPNAKDEEFLTALADLQPDLCITAAYGCFLPQRFLDMPKFGTLNVHPSLLPLYRGAAPLQRCLEAGDAVGGVTVAFTVLKMDAGPVLRQQTRAMEGDEQFPELLVEMFETGTELLIDALPSVWDGSCQEVLAPQDNEAATGAKKVQKEEAELDLSAISALQAHNRVRAFAGWPGTWAWLQAGDAAPVKAKLLKTRPAPAEAARPDGREVVLSKDKKSLQLACADGSVLEVLELTLPGKKPVGAKAFWNGCKDKGARWSTSGDMEPADAA